MDDRGLLFLQLLDDARQRKEQPRGVLRWQGLARGGY
jgi:hypothetical protein